MRLQLLDEMMARRRIGGDAEDPAGILIQPVNRQELQPPISRRERFARRPALLRLEFARQKISQNAQRRKIALRRRHRKSAPAPC